MTNPVTRSFNPTSTGGSPGNTYNLLKNSIKAALDAITRNHGSYNLKATMWIQGEADSNDLSNSLDYRANFNTTFNQLKTDCGVADFKVYVAKLSVGAAAANLYYANINSQIDDLLSNGDIYGVIDTDSLTTQDGQHYNSASLDALGELFFNAINP